MRVYAIGDIHGQLDMLCAAHARIAKDRETTGDQEAPVVHLGDFCDRGPDTRGVIDHLIGGRDRGAAWIFLRGNHDRLFQRYLDSGEETDGILREGMTWMHDRMGGRETLASYGVEKHWWTGAQALRNEALAAVPDAHRAFLASLELSFETDALFFCHAGIRPGVAFSEQVEDDLVWIRSPFLEDTRDHGKIVVHGHTVVEAPEHHGNRIALDTGAGYFQPLTAAVFEGAVAHILTDQGRIRLDPIRD